MSRVGIKARAPSKRGAFKPPGQRHDARRDQGWVGGDRRGVSRDFQRLAEQSSARLAGKCFKQFYAGMNGISWGFEFR